MKTKFRFLRVLQKDGKERGASLVEYGLLIALIAVIGIPAVTAVGENIALTLGNTDMAEALAGGSDIVTP